MSRGCGKPAAKDNGHVILKRSVRETDEVNEVPRGRTQVRAIAMRTMSGRFAYRSRPSDATSSANEWVALIDRDRRSVPLAR